LGENNRVEKENYHQNEESSTKEKFTFLKEARISGGRKKGEVHKEGRPKLEGFS
jgi:hypothetical protein